MACLQKLKIRMVSDIYKQSLSSGPDWKKKYLHSVKHCGPYDFYLYGLIEIHTPNKPLLFVWNKKSTKVEVMVCLVDIFFFGKKSKNKIKIYTPYAFYPKHAGGN